MKLPEVTERTVFSCSGLEARRRESNCGSGPYWYIDRASTSPPEGLAHLHLNTGKVDFFNVTINMYERALIHQLAALILFKEKCS